MKDLTPFITKKTICARAPGRINFIGEHTDYNNGFVLPASIDKAIYVALTPREDQTIHLHSLDFGEHFFSDTGVRKRTECLWANYILGVVDQFRFHREYLPGFDLVFYGDVPIGGGLSSSAAVECASALVLNEYYQTNLDKIELVRMSQQAEHNFAGVQCGIMDQFTSLYGKKDHALRLDCLSLDFEYIPIAMRGFSIALFDTQIKHSLASSNYNRRRNECTAGVKIISKYRQDVRSLRDVNMDLLNEYVLPLDQTIFNRCRYVIEENARVLEACQYLKGGKLEQFGQKMFEGHEGLKSLYEVSCPELDFLVEFAQKEDSIIGARMMGGGFGGCTINLIRTEDLDELSKKIKEAYAKTHHKMLGIHVVALDDGGDIYGT